MIEVRLFSRDKKIGNFSIEELFSQITLNLQKRVKFHHSYTVKEYNLLKNIFLLSKDNSKINHVTGDVNYLCLGLPKNNTILTVHDLGHYENTLKGWKKHIYKFLWLDLPFNSVGNITCISEFTKERIIKYCKIDPSKIKVIYNPYPKEFHYSPKSKINEVPIILQIGSGHNKNVEKLILAVKDYRCKIVFIGRLSNITLGLLEIYNIDFICRTNLTYQEIYEEYVKCDLLYFASTYEGFGMPIVEAQAVGRPVITSNVAAMPEIAGDGAILVDPTNENDILDAIKTICDDETKRTELVNNGLKNIERFEIDKICNSYFELYQSIWVK